MTESKKESKSKADPALREASPKEVTSKERPRSGAEKETDSEQTQIKEATPSQHKPIEALFGGQLNGIIALCYENERPLQGLSGLLDWHFQGQISSYIRAGKITGAIGECTYIPCKKQDKTYHLLLVGAGSNSKPGKRNIPPAATLSTLQKNLPTLKISNLGISRQDFGVVSRDFFAEKLKEVPLWIVQ